MRIHIVDQFSEKGCHILMFVSFVVGVLGKEIILPLYISLIFVGLIWVLVFYFAVGYAVENGFKELEIYFHNNFDEMVSPLILGPIYAYGCYFMGVALASAIEWLSV